MQHTGGTRAVMSTLAPPANSYRRPSTHYYNHNSGAPCSPTSSSPSAKSSNLEDGGGQASPLPPPLPQRPHTLRPAARANRDSYYCYYSDDSGSTRLPVFPEDSDAFIRLQQHHTRPTVAGGGTARGSTNKQLCHERRPPVAGTAVVHPCRYSAVATGAGRGAPTSSSSVSPAAGGAAAAAGSCETCESVCYYLLQVAFAMGVLIGTSLCIAGAALRRSPGRQLQVLLYIGALVALVSALLLVVQCRARKQANRYYLQQQAPQATIVVAAQQRQRRFMAAGGNDLPVLDDPAHCGGGGGHAPPRQMRTMQQCQQHPHPHPHPHVAVATMQRGVPVTLLQQHARNQAHNSGEEGRNRRIII